MNPPEGFVGVHTLSGCYFLVRKLYMFYTYLGNCRGRVVKLAVELDEEL